MPSHLGRAIAPLLALSALVGAFPSSASEALRHPDAPEVNRQAPDRFLVRMETSKGLVVLEVHRAWAPHGADRFYNLVENGFYDEARFFRVVAGRWAQFGIPADPEIATLWRGRTIADDPRRESNRRGTVAFAFAVPNGRTTQVFINLKDNAETLDPQGFAPFGRVIEGMEAVDALNAEYGESAGGGIRGGKQDPLFAGGNQYLAREFPRLDFVRRATAVATYPEPVEGDFVLRDFRFSTGETLPELKLHYRTLGRPVQDERGVTKNAVLILHGTGGSGAGFLADNFAGQLFGPGQLLDASRYFIVLPDGIGHGRSSKPSDGLRLRFPRYTYDDMVAAQHRLLTEGLRVNHLRLVLGTSMGGMHTWVWGERYPDFMEGLVPLASVPTQIAGRNRVMRKMIADSIRGDPEWKGGDYTEPPRRGLTGALNILLMMTSSPLQWHKAAPTRDQADAMLAEQIRRRLATTDANDMLYAFDASRDYDPSKELETIVAPVLAINSADDVVNPPELGLMEALMPRVRRGRYVLIPTSDETRGHGTHSWPAVWRRHLEAFLKEGHEMTETAAADVSKEVQATLDAFRAHSAAGDWDAVTALYLDSPQFRWIEEGRVKYRSVDEIRKSLTGMPAGTRIQTTYEDTEITPLSANVAVVVTQFATRVRIPQSGGFSFGGTLTITFVRHDGQWKIAAGHTSSPVASASP